jgi:uncharacterized protein YkwD
VSALIAGLFSLAISVSASDLEEKAGRYVSEQFGRVGRTAPQLDPKLSAAARSLAKKALERGVAEAVKMPSVSEAVSKAEGSDPSPRAFATRASPPEHALDSFLKRSDLNEEAASRMGIGAALANGRGAIVALLSVQKAELKPFPRSFAKPRTADLCGKLLTPLTTPKVFVTQPSGEVDRVLPFKDSADGFCARIPFSRRGHYSVEVVGQSNRGPEVASLFSVAVGSQEPIEESARLSEPKSPAEARTAILARINGMRAADKLPPLDEDPALDRLAQSYSERMATENFFSHVSPDGLDLKTRLNKGGYAYQRAGENLGLAAGPIAAEWSIEQSPGHRRNLLDPNFSRIGIGVAFSKREHPQALVTEILAKPPAQGRDPVEEAYRSVQQKRAELHLPALKRNEVLEQLALEHVHRALELGQPKPELPGDSLQEQIFSSLQDVSRTSVEFFVSDSPAQVANSKNLADRKNDLVGIGAIRNDASSHGRGKYWVLVIYAAGRESASRHRDVR